MTAHPDPGRRQLRFLGGLALSLIGLILFLSFAAHPVQAHSGGTPQLTNAEAGPYRVSVWTGPDPVRAGELHVSVAVVESTEPGASQEEIGNLVLNATVQVRVEPIGQTGDALIAYATHENAVNKLLYEADLDLPAEGQWRVTIQVEGPAGAGSAAFEIEALPTSPSNIFLAVPWPVWAGLIVAVFAIGWLVQMSRSQKPEAQHA
jgi:hypothetical protein